MEKIHKTAKDCMHNVSDSLKQHKIQAMLLKKYYANLDEIRKLTQLEDVLTRSMEDIRRIMLEGG